MSLLSISENKAAKISKFPVFTISGKPPVSVYFCQEPELALNLLNNKNSVYENGNNSFEICRPVSFVPSSLLSIEAFEPVITIL